jgi:hypothetical protein
MNNLSAINLNSFSSAMGGMFAKNIAETKFSPKTFAAAFSEKLSAKNSKDGYVPSESIPSRNTYSPKNKGLEHPKAHVPNSSSAKDVTASKDGENGSVGSAGEFRFTNRTNRTPAKSPNGETVPTKNNPTPNPRDGNNGEITNGNTSTQPSNNAGKTCGSRKAVTLPLKPSKNTLDPDTYDGPIAYDPNGNRIYFTKVEGEPYRPGYVRVLDDGRIQHILSSEWTPELAGQWSELVEAGKAGLFLDIVFKLTGIDWRTYGQDESIPQ